MVEKGRIVEKGDHASLFARGGRYFEMNTRQHGVESNLFLARGDGNEPAEAPAAATGAPASDGASLARGLDLLRRR